MPFTAAAIILRNFNLYLNSNMNIERIVFNVILCESFFDRKIKKNYKIHKAHFDGS